MIVALIPVVVELIRQADRIFKGAKRGAARRAWVKEHAQAGREVDGAFLDQLIDQVHEDLKRVQAAKGFAGEGAAPTLCCAACGGTHLVPVAERPPMIGLTFAKPPPAETKPKKQKARSDS